jgi:hypothetical protein
MAHGGHHDHQLVALFPAGGDAACDRLDAGDVGDAW